MSAPDVLVVGGGIWGLSVAWHLAAAHHATVQVLERRAFPGEETSARAAGQIGQVRETSVARDAAHYALEFAASLARRRDTSLFVRSGSVTVIGTPEGAAAVRSRFAAASASGIGVELLSPQDAGRLVPGLSGEVVTAYHVPSDGYVQPVRFSRALADEARDAGVHVTCDLTVIGIDADASRVHGVRTSRGRFTAGHVLVAAGPWTATLLPASMPPVAAWPILLRQALTAPDNVPRHHPIVRLPELGAYVRPERRGYLFGAFRPDPEMAAAPTLPASGRTEDIAMQPASIEHLRTRLSTFLPALAGLRLVEHRHGWTTFSPDGLPIAGRHPTAENLWLATACGAMGFVWAPIVGRWIAQSIAEGNAVPALSALAPARFGPLGSDLTSLRDACRRRHANYYGLADGGTAAPAGGPSAEHYSWK